MWILIFPEGVEFLLHWCFRIYVGEGARSISHCGSDSLSREVSKSPLAFSFKLGIPMNCGREKSVGIIMSSEGNHFNFLFDWPLLAAPPLAIPQDGEVSIQEGGNKHRKISLFIVPETLVQKRGEFVCWSQAQADGIFLRHLFSSCLHPLWRPEWMPVNVKNYTKSV